MFTCEYCGAQFTPYRSKNKYCSSSCSRKAWYHNNPAKQSQINKQRNDKHYASRAQKIKRRRHWLAKYKVSCGCQLCGYKEHHLALCFDHLDPSIKEFSVSSSRIGGSLKTLIQEVRKCRVLCCNCHMIYTYGKDDANSN